MVTIGGGKEGNVGHHTADYLLCESTCSCLSLHARPAPAHKRVFVGKFLLLTLLILLRAGTSTSSKSPLPGFAKAHSADFHSSGFVSPFLCVSPTIVMCCNRGNYLYLYFYLFYILYCVIVMVTTICISILICFTLVIMLLTY